MIEDGCVKVFGWTHDSFERIPLPEGETCLHCGEQILQTEIGYSTMFLDESGPRRTYQHRACFQRGIVGSVAHIERRCSCYVAGAEEWDDPSLTKRQAAEASVVAFRKLHEKEHLRETRLSMWGIARSFWDFVGYVRGISWRPWAFLQGGRDNDTHYRM